VDRNAILREAIGSWMARVMAARPATPLDDLHVDQVDEAFTDRSRWLDGAILCLEAATSLRDMRSLPVTIALGMSLKPSNLPLGVTFAKWRELEGELDDSPPSLYVWGEGEDPVGIKATHVFDLSGLMVPTAVQLRKQLSEWYDAADGEFRRSVWLLA
jgi:hypothetical protein